MPGTSINKITVYKLTDEDVTSLRIPDHLLVKEGIWTEGERSYSFKLFFHKGRMRTAPWLSVFSPLGLTISDEEIPKYSMSGFALVIHVNSSWYGVVGGISHIHLRKHCAIEHRFGIELAQRILAANELRGLSQRDTSGIVNTLDRVFRGYYDPQGDITNLKRVLTHLRGTIKKNNPLHEAIGSSIKASDSLTVSGSKNFSEIIDFLEEVESLMREGRVLISIPQLEHINKATHAKLLEELELYLANSLASYNPEEDHYLFLDNEDIGFLPDRVEKYSLIFSRRVYELSTVSDVFEKVRALLNEEEAKADRVRAIRRMNLRVHFDEGIVEMRSLLYFICGDIDYNNNVYFINNMLWYRASDAFLKSLASELDNIECLDPQSIGLLEWDRANHLREDDYNKAHTRLLNLDGRLVNLPKEEEKGGIELCDLLNYSSGKARLVHVKHASGAALRALFAQGYVSAKLFAESETFRQEVYKGHFKKVDPPLSADDLAVLANLKKLHRRELQIVYAIFDYKPSHHVADKSSNTSEVLKGTLSTFAKIDLLDRILAIRALGYGVAISRIKPYPRKVNAKAT